MASRGILAGFVLSGIMLAGCHSVTRMMGGHKKIFPDIADEFLEMRDHVIGPHVQFKPSRHDRKMHDVALMYHDTMTHEKWWIHLHDYKKDGQVTPRDIVSFMHLDPNHSEQSYAMHYFAKNEMLYTVYSKQDEAPLYRESYRGMLNQDGDMILQKLFPDLNFIR